MRNVCCSKEHYVYWSPGYNIVNSAHIWNMSSCSASVAGALFPRHLHSVIPSPTSMLADSSKSSMVEVSSSCKEQLRFWKLTLLACNGRLSIPGEEGGPPIWAVNIYTDAAGGTLESSSRGSGCVCGLKWFYESTSRGPWKSTGLLEGGWQEGGKEAVSAGCCPCESGWTRRFGRHMEEGIQQLLQASWAQPS